MTLNSIFKTVSMIDLYSQGVELTINGERRSNTILGGILTIITVAVLVSLFVINGEDLYYHINPIISTDRKYSIESHNIYLNRSTFPISFLLTGNDNEAVIKPKYFKFKITYYSGDTEFDLNEDELQYEYCNSSLHFPLVSTQFDDGGYVNAYCLVNDSLLIKGTWSENYISYLSIKLFYCNNKEESNQCAPQEEIENFIRQGELYFNLIYMDSSFSPNNYFEPISRKINIQYTSVAIGFTKLLEFYLMPRHLNTDDGLIWNLNKTQTVVSVDSFTDDFQTLNTENNDNYIAEFTINSSKASEETKREYTKIQTLMANLGGIGNFLLIFFKIICYKFSIEKRDEAILNKIFDFELERHKSKNKVQSMQRYSNSSGNRKKSLLHLQSMFEKSGFLEKRRLYKPNTAIEKTTTTNRMINSTGENMINNKDLKINTRRRASIISPGPNRSFNNISPIHKDSNNSICSSIISSSVMEPEDFPCFTEPDRIINKETIMYQLEKENKQKESKLQKRKIIKAQQKTLNELIKYLDEKSKKNQLHFTFCEVILLFCGKICLCFRCRKFKDKLLLYKRSSYAIKDYIDLTFIILKLDEFEKFKFIMLTNDQLALFNFIGKDVCSINQKHQNTSEIHKMKNYNKNKHVLMSRLIMSYQQRKEIEGQKVLSDMEIKLFSMLRPEIREICK